MPGPAPKDPKLRQRRNRTATAATLYVVEPINGQPELPKRRPDRKKWHAWTLEWWGLVWQSEMREEFLRSDVPVLVRLALLVDNYARDPRPSLAAEIRMQEQRFGLTPLDRRRLQWEVRRANEAERKNKPLTPREQKDPRANLTVVQ